MNPHEYLAAGNFIDWRDEAVFNKARVLSEGARDDTEIAQRCFEFVRDTIKHSGDFALNTVTCKASEVLQHGTGFCYAKSHLLAALLRANEIPAGLCYQRLTVESETAAFCLHGLNAIYLKDYGWYRVDARGNKQGVNAQFIPPQEQLAFQLTTPGEMDLPDYWVEPLPLIVKLLSNSNTVQEVAANLPDVPLLSL